MNEQQLPGESNITTLWIIGVILTLSGICCGFFTTIPGLILCIVCLRKANKNIRLYYASPGQYRSQSLSAVNAGKVISIIALIISSVISLFYLMYFMVYGAFVGSMLWGAWKASQNEYDYNEADSVWKEEVYDYDTWDETDTISEDTWVVDSLRVDSLRVDTLRQP